ncbi:MAG: hypothetical protein R3F31_24145 [Verrucomicrobiales bacterium]
MKLWHFKDDAEAMAYGGNPVDNLAPLAKAGVPLLHVYGDADTVVPWRRTPKSSRNATKPSAATSP